MLRPTALRWRRCAQGCAGLCDPLLHAARSQPGQGRWVRPTVAVGLEVRHDASGPLG